MQKNNKNTQSHIFKLAFICICLVFSTLLFAGGDYHANNHSEEKFDVNEMIFHHIGDAHEAQIVGDIKIPLPCIFYNKQTGKVDAFMSSAFNAHHGDGTTAVNGYKMSHGLIERTDNAEFMDFSITKNVFYMWLVAMLVAFAFGSMANQYKKNKGLKAPKGIAKLLEPLFLFVRDDIAKENIGEHKYQKFFPYLLALFFFILGMNLFGLIPIFSANITGNIAVTLLLALITMIIVNVNGNGHYWSHMLKPDAPKPLWLILVPIELAGILIKPVSLMIRLFANITAGHIIILSLTSLIFILGAVDGVPGKNVVGATSGGVLAFVFVLFMNAIELFVAFLQAYIFTLLSAIYIGQAVEEPAHH